MSLFINGVVPSAGYAFKPASNQEAQKAITLLQQGIVPTTPDHKHGVVLATGQDPHTVNPAEALFEISMPVMMSLAEEERVAEMLSGLSGLPKPFIG